MASARQATASARRSRRGIRHSAANVPPSPATRSTRSRSSSRRSSIARCASNTEPPAEWGSTSIVPEVGTVPGRRTRRYHPVRPDDRMRGPTRALARCTVSFWHGHRGWQISSTASPQCQRSPMCAVVSVAPKVDRFSPNGAEPVLVSSGSSRSVAHAARCSAGCAYTALSGPPCTVRSAWSSPARLIGPRWSSVPSTAVLAIADVRPSADSPIGAGRATRTVSNLIGDVASGRVVASRALTAPTLGSAG